MNTIETVAATAGFPQNGIAATSLNQSAAIADNSVSSREPMAPAVSEYFDGSPVPTFAIDMEHVVTHWNKACEQATGRSPIEIVGSRNHWQPFYPEQRPVMADLIVDGSIETLASTYYQDKFKPSSLIPGAYEEEDFSLTSEKMGVGYFFLPRHCAIATGGLSAPSKPCRT